MKFLPPSLIKQQISRFNFPLSEGEREDFVQALRTSFSELSSEEMNQYALFCSDRKYLLFFSWIEATPVLDNCLKEQSIQEVYKDTNKLHDHQLYSDFQAFVTPFLAPILLEELSHLSLNRVNYWMSYSTLLNTPQLLDQLSLWLRSQLDEVENQAKYTADDVALAQLAQSVLSDELIRGLNLLPVSHYYIKRSLVDFFLQWTQHPKSSNRLMAYIINRLKEIDLTAEHTAQINEFGNKLKLRNRPISRMRTIVVIAVLVGLLATVLYVLLVRYSPQASGSKQQQDRTSYMDMSPQERKRIDSIIQALDAENQQEMESSHFLPYVGEPIITKQEWTNKQFQFLFEKWMKVEEEQLHTIENNEKRRSAYPGSVDLKKMSGKMDVEFRNETMKEVLLLVFRNEVDKPVYTHYVDSGKLFTWKGNAGDLLVVVSGRGIGFTKTFGDFPFADLDKEFKSNLQETYHFRSFAAEKVKLVWKKTKNKNYLVDLSFVLERIS